MTLISRQTLSTCWRDPLRRLLHRTFKAVYVPYAGAQHHVVYSTYCGHRLTVDDINTRTMIDGAPTCMSCVIAPHIDDVLPTQE